MAEKTTISHQTERVAISPSGGGTRIWVGDDVRLTLDWEQARQLHRLLANELGRKADR